MTRQPHHSGSCVRSQSLTHNSLSALSSHSHTGNVCRALLPEDYANWLEILELPTLCDFISEMSKTVFNNIASNEDHPLFSCVVFNCAKVSSCLHTIYRPPKCRTQKHLKSFFPYHISAFNKVEISHFHVPIQFYRLLIHGLK